MIPKIRNNPSAIKINLDIESIQDTSNKLANKNNPINKIINQSTYKTKIEYQPKKRRNERK